LRGWIKKRRVGQTSGWSIHHLGLLQRTVHIIWFDSGGRRYLQKRSAPNDQFRGESYETCARRELGEELGINSKLYWDARMLASAETGWENGDF